MDRTAWELVKTVLYSDDKRQSRDAGNTLIGLLPTFDDYSIDDVEKEMTDIIRYSGDEQRRRVAQDVLITFKNIKNIGF